jgi:hypothetical protein
MFWFFGALKWRSGDLVGMLVWHVYRDKGT